MWFKNLIVYRLDENLDIAPDQWQELLEARAFTPCSSQQPASMGWAPPLGRGASELAHTGTGFTLLSARREERLLPPGVVREAVDEKVAAIELDQGRRVGRKERRDLAEEITFELMPKAFTRSRHTSGMLLQGQKLLLVDSASRTRAEEWLELLRECVGSLPVRPVTTGTAPTSVFTGWLSGERPLPTGVVLGDQCELRSPLEDGATARISRQSLEGEEIATHLAAGKLAFKLALEWNETTSFVLTDALEFKRLRFSDVMQEQASQDGAADAAAEFDAGAHLMALELARMLPAVWELFGGLAEAEG